MTENFLQQKISYAGSVSSMNEFGESVENQNPAVLSDKFGVINKMFTKVLENLRKNERGKIVELDLMETTGE